jgi:hypothetical protein
MEMKVIDFPTGVSLHDQEGESTNIHSWEPVGMITVQFWGILIQPRAMSKHFRPNSGVAGTKSRIEIFFFVVVVSGNVISIRVSCPCFKTVPPWQIRSRFLMVTMTFCCVSPNLRPAIPSRISWKAKRRVMST